MFDLELLQACIWENPTSSTHDEHQMNLFLQLTWSGHSSNQP